jgi:hypothetical protein
MSEELSTISFYKRPIVAILFFGHKFDAVKGPAYLLSEGFKSRDWDVLIINASEQNMELLREQINSLIRNEFDLILSITPIPLTLTIGDKYLGEYLTRPVAIWFVDSPIYMSSEQLEFIKKIPERSLLLFVDADHTKLMREAMEANCPGRFLYGFMPFGITKNIDNFLDNDNAFSNHETREIDISIFATLDLQMNEFVKNNDKYDYKFPYLKSDRFQSQYNSIQSLAEEVIDSRYGEDLVSILSDQFNLEILFNDDEEKEFLQIFDSFIKRYRRLSLVQGILNNSSSNGLKVAIYGTGWQNLKDIPDNCTIFQPSPYLEQFKVFCRSRAILNLDPNWSHGVHDRVFNAISVGTAVLTNNNSYANQILHHNYDCLLFDSKLKAIENLNLLKSRSQSLTENAKSLITIGGISWNDRVSGLVNFAQSITI